MRKRRRAGATNRLFVLGMASTIVLGMLAILLVGPKSLIPNGLLNWGSTASPSESQDEPLFLYCAAGLRYAMDDVVADFQEDTGIAIQMTYGGSNTLLNQLEVSKTGDLYLAADDGYVRQAREKGLAAESIPVASMRPVILVAANNPLSIESIEDLLQDDVKVAMGNPDAAAVGRKTRRLLVNSGHWDRLQKQITAKGVFQPTVNEVANDVKLGSVDAGIVWDTTAVQYPDLQVVSVPELDLGRSQIELAVLTSSGSPSTALRFARYATARDRGLRTFRKKGFDVVDGDVWAEEPELTFFAGAVNRRALEPVIEAFERREGVKVNTVYNGCGILTSQMRTIRENQDGGFPDTFMACDVYYLDEVQDLFEQGQDVSDTDIVIVVAAGNPKGIETLSDLTRPGIRVALGQPDQCTIGILSRRLLEDEGMYEQVKANLVQETPSSAMLVPNVATGAADAVLAYRTDTLAEKSRLQVVGIDSPLAKAVQPFSVARSSDHKRLANRLFQTISRSRAAFEAAGFNWRLDAMTATPADGKSSSSAINP